MAGTKVATGIGLRQLQVAARLTAPGTVQWIAVPAATDASFKMAVSTVEQWGDDQLQNSFYHSQKGTITCKASYTAMAVLEALSGNTVVSSTGAGEVISIGTLAELTPPHVAVKAVVANARRNDGTATTISVIFYNASAATVFTDISASTGALQMMTLNFETFSSTLDENGNPLTNTAHGRLVIG
jgi:hypothetical protein